jgi:predicted CXXCH cytochrome family protein
MSPRRMLLLVFLVPMSVVLAATNAAAVDQCLECHASFKGHRGQAGRAFRDDIHAKNGLTCAICHGGDPNEDDADRSMDPKKGYRGIPKRTDIPQLCGRCHSDGTFMRAYNPSLRVDQLAQYWTSVHGRKLRAGDTRVAVCSDCHSAHCIRPASSPLSSVYPLAIPATCGQCHSDPERMRPYGIPTHQLDEYRASIHYQALTGGDLSAPTCATCHGNHGAAPPGVASVARVCGTCHTFQEQLFAQSPHYAPFEKKNLSGCLVCHGNHGIRRPSDVTLAMNHDSLCLKCHAADDKAGSSAKRIYADLTSLDASLHSAAGLLDRAERAGMEVGEARLTLSSGNEKLIKARVDVHTMLPDRVERDTAEGHKLMLEAEQAGQQALAEHTFRRKGLALSLVLIAFVASALWLLIRSLESSSANG